MTYTETLDYLYARLPMFQRIGDAAFKKDLTNTRLLCEALGNPQNAYKSIHIAGTNGKGSTSHLTASILQEAGMRVGLYTSPHYKDFRERVRVNGEMMSEDFVVDFVARLRPEIERIQPSFFEITVVMAFEYFKREGVDIAVVEVGMGGRFDSTNVLSELSYCVITNIDLDHQQFLGETRAEIAFEKAGIMKPRVPVFISERHPETEEVFVKRAAEVNCPIIFTEDYAKAVLQEIDYEQGLALYEFSTEGVKAKDRHWVGLLGRYQAKNIATAALSVGLVLDEAEANMEGALGRGLRNVVKNTGLMGRWQFLQQAPFSVLVDAGHNAHGLQQVLLGLSELGYDRLFFVFGMVRDKKATQVLEMLPKSDTTYYFCAANIPRARPAAELQAEAKDFGLEGEHYESVQAGYQKALADAAAYKSAYPNSRPLVFIGGSIFVVAEVL